jgi:hypothetical protein
MRERCGVEGSVIVAAALLAIVAAGFAIWLVPRGQVARWRRDGIAEEKLAELGVQARSAITQAIGGLALIITIAITADQATEARRSADDTQKAADKNLKIAIAQVELAKAQVRLAEEGQVAERFSRAVDQLGATNSRGESAVDVRTGALFSLMQVALRSDGYTEPVFRVASAYVRNNFEKPSKLAAHGCRARFDLGADVQIALSSVLPAVGQKQRKLSQQKQLTGLRGAELKGLAIDEVVLRNLDLTGIRFSRASLNGADFSDSKLLRAQFQRACLKAANFRNADLRGARFDGANLQGANFEDAKLNKADLEHAGLSQAQVASLKNP